MKTFLRYYWTIWLAVAILLAILGHFVTASICIVMGYYSYIDQNRSKA